MWAEREFGAAHADEIAKLVTQYTQYNGRRKPELLDIDTFSLVNYREADRVEADWKALLSKAETLQKLLPQEQQDAYFELVQHPIKASAIVNELYIAAGRNRLYARQGRADANDYAKQARALFQADAEVTNEYNHVLANGKWNHMMDQTHLGYTYWQEPPLNVMPAVAEVQPVAEPRMGLDVEGSSGTFGPMQLTFDSYRQQSRYIDVFNHGVGTFHFDAKASDPWIVLSSANGEVSKTERLVVSVDWERTPAGKAQGEIAITQADGTAVKVRVSAFHPEAPSRDAIDGFVEGDGYVSMEAEHYTHAASAGEVHWDKIPEYGATLSGMSVFPVTTASIVAPQPTATLEYHMYLFDKGTYNLQTILGPTLNFVPGRGLRLTVALDDQTPQVIDTLEHNTDKDWEKVVSDGVRRVETKLNVEQPGHHTLKIGVVDSGIVLEKLVLSVGPLKPSYLGPPESFHGALTQTK